LTLVTAAQFSKSFMQRVDAPEILDSDACSPADVQETLQDIGRVNRWFGGVATTQKMVERVARACEAKHFSLLEVAAGSGELPEIVRQKLARRGIKLDVTLLDRARSHLPVDDGVVADALAMPFGDDSFDMVSCNLFAHHLQPEQLVQFVREGLRVCRRALLINDLIRHPVHLAFAYAGYPIMRSRVAWLDGLTSVRRAYVPDEMQTMLASVLPQTAAQVEISRNYLFRMGVIVWKKPLQARASGRPALP
jgi:hypothetical protein